MTDEQSNVAVDLVAPPRVYEQYPVTNVRPHMIPDDAYWKPCGDDTKTYKELTLSFQLDPCRAWAARLIRLAPVSPPDPQLQGGRWCARFVSRVSGCASREVAERAVVEAARIAGWVE